MSRFGDWLVLTERSVVRGQPPTAGVAISYMRLPLSTLKTEQNVRTSILPYHMN